MNRNNLRNGSENRDLNVVNCIICWHKKRIILLMLILGGIVVLSGCASKPALHTALYDGDIVKATSLIEKGADIEEKDSGGWTPLMYALRYDQPEGAKLLIKKGADINATEPNGWTPLMFALRHKQPDNARLLIEKGANIHEKMPDGWTPLIFALRYDQPNNAKLLIDKGAAINVKTDDGWTPLMLALHYKQPDNARLLIEKGANIHEKMPDGWTPLIFALRYDQPSNAKLLIDKGAAINAKTENGWSPLMFALRYKQPDNAKLLIEKGADISETNSYGVTPLMFAAGYSEPRNTELLIAHGANIEEKSLDGETPLIYALRHNQSENYGLLIDNGANVHVVNNKGNTPLIVLAELDNPALEPVILLVDKGVNINQTNNIGDTAFKAACRKGNEGIATYLYEHGADTAIEEETKDGQELNAIKNHIIGDYLLAKDEYDASRNSYLQAKEYYSKTLANYNSELTKIAVKKIFAVVAMSLLNATAQHYQAKQARMQSRRMAQISGLKYANKTNTGLAGYSAFMQKYNTTYTPTLSYARLTPPAAISEKSNIEEKRAYAKAKVGYFEERLKIVNSTLSCYESSNGPDIHECVASQLEKTKQ